MTPLHALNQLYLASTKTPMVLQDHENCKQFYKIIEDALTPKVTEPALDPKSE